VGEAVANSAGSSGPAPQIQGLDYCGFAVAGDRNDQFTAAVTTFLARLPSR